MQSSEVDSQDQNEVGFLPESSIGDCQSFEELVGQYNLLNFSHYARLFTNVLLGEIKKISGPTRVLDIGCGCGIGRQLPPQQRIHEAAGEFWGIEPDTSVIPLDGVFDHFQHALMETANLSENSFDLAYSSMVMEHVADPDAFLSSLHRCLKPGGVYLFLTPNAQSMIPLITKICHNLHIDDFVLRLVKGAQQMEEYHYPVQFKFNTPAQVDRYSQEIGFRHPEYAFIEGNGVRGYFPGPLRLAYYFLLTKRRLIKKPNRLATMICRLTKNS